MSLSSSALIGLACILSNGRHPELDTTVKQMSPAEQTVVSQIIQSGLCQSPEFQKLILNNPNSQNGKGTFPDDSQIMSCVQTTDEK
jgi:hypothetical protein